MIRVELEVNRTHNHHQTPDLTYFMFCNHDFWFCSTTLRTHTKYLRIEWKQKIFTIQFHRLIYDTEEWRDEMSEVKLMGGI